MKPKSRRSILYEKKKVYYIRNMYNIISFPLFAFYNYSFGFTHKFKHPNYDIARWSPTIYNKITKIPSNIQDITIIITNSIKYNR
jgi:hypothetical protein